MTTRVRIKKAYLPKGWSDREYNAKWIDNDDCIIGKTTFYRKQLTTVSSPNDQPITHFVRKVSSVAKDEVIHCPTEREAEAICKLMHEQGWTWNTGHSFSNSTNWNHYKEDTCYSPRHGVYGMASLRTSTTPASAFLPTSFYEEQPKEHSITEESPVLDNKYIAIGTYIENESPSARELFTWLLANEHI
jgi:hypothetical protein